MYIACLFHSLSNEVKKVNTTKSSPGPRPVSVALGKYQSDLEEVLTWLLEAEEKLSFPFEECNNLTTARNYFNDYNEFLEEIRRHRMEIGDVLLQGSNIISLGDLSVEEENEVRLQISLLDSRWEQLRLAAMEKQSKVIEHLMKNQNSELENFKEWLNDVEIRITRLTTHSGTLTERLNQALALQKEIQDHERIAESLKKLVLVEDANFESSNNSLHIFILIA